MVFLRNPKISKQSKDLLFEGTLSIEAQTSLHAASTMNVVDSFLDAEGYRPAGDDARCISTAAADHCLFVVL